MSRNNDDKINWRFAVLGLLAGLAMLVIHWFHRIRFRCKVCHADLGFKFKAGGNKITMAKIINGQFCGACHNGQISWSVENCNMCHSGIPGTPTHIHGSTVQRLVSPPYKPLKATVQQPPQTNK